MPRRRNQRRSPARRRPPSIAQYDRFLVACEGSHTEPEYIRALCDDNSVNRANYRIIADCGNNPLNVVEAAIQEFRTNRDYDAVFCVFDRNGHTDYHSAVERVAQARLTRGKRLGPVKFEAITSNPAFEYWLLLHFRDSTKPYHANAAGSASDNLIRDLRTVLPGYAKGDQGIYDQTHANLDTAVDRSRRVLQAALEHGSENPCSRMHELVTYIRNLVK